MNLRHQAPFDLSRLDFGCVYPVYVFQEKRRRLKRLLARYQRKQRLL